MNYSPSLLFENVTRDVSVIVKYQQNINTSRCVAQSFSGWVRFSKFRLGLLKYYMLNLISDPFKVPSGEYVCK